MSWFDVACVLMRAYPGLSLQDVRRLTRAEAIGMVDRIDRTERFLRTRIEDEP